jgi:hypothetical protein
MSGRVPPASGRFHLKGLGLGSLDARFRLCRPSPSGSLLSLCFTVLHAQALVLGILADLGSFGPALSPTPIAGSPDEGGDEQ